MGGTHKPGKRRHKSPANQYPCNPYARSDLVQQQIAGDFENEVAEIEDPKDQSKLLASDRQFFIHRQRCKANVVAINKRNNEEQEDNGQNPKP